MEKQIVYLDNSATTKPSDASLTKMREALSVSYGNPSSVHLVGNEAHRLLEAARTQVAASLGVRRISDGSVFFTSGGTEANNMAIHGAAFAKNRPEKNGTRGKILISAGEHSSVEKTAAALEAYGFTLVRIPTAGGALDLDFLRESADESVILASIMLVNNETGALYEFRNASDIIKSASPKALVHCDAVQAYMKTKFTPMALGADTLAVSSHKIFAPKGSGALYVSQEVLKGKRLCPLIFGGGQEDGMRSGTENVPAAAAFGAAAAEGAAELEGRIEKSTALREFLLARLNPAVRVNAPAKHIPNIINITLPSIRSETMLNYLSGEGFCVSAGSACSSHAPGVSRALVAYGIPESEADTSLRISLSHKNTEAELSAFAEALSSGISRLQRKR